ncbi:charged multivesicular body protein 3 [Cylas formicarius]|uniref:charged multivesicular body protein 3 n=1 Tax=Cylas formicarius TaxID=197179 RepID=UPI00295855F4|nr:charged multivesicular body protein 3 [Cylas formicarius]
MGLFGKSQGRDPKDMVTEWNHKLRKEGYQLDRQINSIKREEEKIKRTLKEAAKKNDNDTCIILAKEIVKARRAVNKIYTTKAHINSVMLQMKNQLATLRVAGSLQKSTEVLNAMQSLVRVAEISKTMQEMSREMMKAGIIEEMLDESFEIDNSEEMEEAAQQEVDKVLYEITEGKIGEAPSVPPTQVENEHEPETLRDEENESELEEMQSRLAALKS